MTREFLSIPSRWGEFVRSTKVLTGGETLILDSYELDGEPELLLRTTDPEAGVGLLAQLTVFFDDRAVWQRRATDAVVTEFSERTPTAQELEDAAQDLVLQTVEVHSDLSVVLHLDDSCGLHFLQGHWPAVRFDADAKIVDVTVEA